MNRRLALRVCLVAAGMGVAASLGFSAGAQATPDQGAKTSLEVGQVMRVGERVITAEDLIARVWDYESALTPKERLLVPALTYLRDVALLDLESERLGLTFTPEELGTAAVAQIENVKQELHRKTMGTVTYEDWLKQQGLTKEGFESYVRDRAIVILKKRVMVNYFRETTESIELYHILRKRQDEAESTWKRLESAPRDKLVEIFEDEAVKRSTDTNSSMNKGRVGRIFKDAATLVPEAEKAVWTLTDMTYSRPVQTAYGWHVFLRRQTFKPAARTLTEMRAELLKAADADEESFNTWVRWVGTTQKYPIERRLPGYDCKPNQKASK